MSSGESVGSPVTWVGRRRPESALTPSRPVVRERKGGSTYKNFPFVLDPIRTICSDSSREIFPWNQGIFSWAVVAMSFSSCGFWLMMACSSAWPCGQSCAQARAR